MKTLAFSKYQGTGNDFILIDNRNHIFPENKSRLIPFLCDRKFGIGSDGLILIENHPEHDFEMIFYNPDGSQSFCGNGSRCAVAFANQLGIIDNKTTFLAIDGPHLATLIDQNVRVKMADSKLPEKYLNGQFIHTGSPHFIQYVSNIHNYPVFDEGKAIRNKSEIFGKGGTNVNFVEELAKGSVFVRTFERGVENETLSCGTGVTAVALVYGFDKGLNSVMIETPGGKLKVDFEKDPGSGFKNIYLTGPAVQVFEGEFFIPAELS